MRTLPLLLLLSACGAPSDPPASDNPDADTTDGSDGSDGADGADGSDGSNGGDGTDGADGADGTDGGDPTFTDSCEPPDSPASGKPVAWLGDFQQTEGDGDAWFMELVDVELHSSGERVYGAGQGGVMVFDVSNPAAPDLAHMWPDTGPPGRAYRVELNEDDAVLYATNRDEGLDVFDISDPDRLAPVVEMTGDGWEGMAFVPATDRLYVTSLKGALLVFDVSDGDDPIQVAEMTGLGNPWDVHVDGSVAYIADNTLGVVSVDLSDPDAPAVLDSLDVGGGVQDLALGDGVLYAAAGGAGVVVVDATNPSALSVVTAIESGDAVQSVALDGGFLYAANRADLVALDVSDPRAPAPHGTLATPEFAMHVAARDGLVAVGDWTRLILAEVEPGATAPDIELSAHEIYVREEGDVATVEIRNTGNLDLVLTGGRVDDPAFTLSVGQTTLAPGETTDLTIDFAGGADIDAALCVASTDPDMPQAAIPIGTGGRGALEQLGRPATDFALQDLDGDTWRLSDHLGSPVVLVFFGTWCPQCASHVSNVETTLWQAYADQGVQVWGLTNREPEHVVDNYVENMGLTFPVLVDLSGTVYPAYQQDMPFPTGAYPQDWIVGADGTIVYAHNEFEPDAMVEVIERELGR